MSFIPPLSLGKGRTLKVLVSNNHQTFHSYSIGKDFGEFVAESTFGIENTTHTKAPPLAYDSRHQHGGSTWPVVSNHVFIFSPYLWGRWSILAAQIPDPWVTWVFHPPCWTLKINLRRITPFLMVSGLAWLQPCRAAPGNMLAGGIDDDEAGRRFHGWVEDVCVYRKNGWFFERSLRLVNLGEGGSWNQKNVSLDGVQDVNWRIVQWLRCCFEFAIWWIYPPNQDAKSQNEGWIILVVTGTLSEGYIQIVPHMTIFGCWHSAKWLYC